MRLSVHNSGSYKSDQLKNFEAELERLSTQAQLMKPLESKILKESGLLANHKVLEVGCGPGFITSILCELASEGQIISTDTDENLLKICRQRIKIFPKNGFEAINSSITSLSALNGSIDYSYLRFVLQHVPDKEKLIQQVFDTLKPNGIICALDSDDGLIVQYPEDPFIKEILINAKQRQNEKGGDRHVGRKISSLFSQNCFKDIKSRVLNFTSSDIPFSILARILLGFKSDLSGKRKEVDEWINQTAPKIERGEYFLSAGVILTTAKKP
jgi:ubiquinone/menaquinone biosynthesis C-methylase UbiE